MCVQAGDRMLEANRRGKAETCLESERCRQISCDAYRLRLRVSKKKVKSKRAS